MILLAVDGENRSDQALPVVAALALSGPHRVLALHVSSDAWRSADPAAGAAQVLSGFGVDAGSDTILDPAGQVAADVLRRARTEVAGVIALGSHGRSSLGGLFLGSVSHQVLAGADCQVLIVPPGGPAEPVCPADISRLLVAVDLSAESLAALAAVERLAPALGARVLVAHVSTGLQTAEAARNRVRQAVERLKRRGVRAAWTIHPQLPGIPERIAGIADDFEADLVVLGSRRHGDLASALAGSVVHSLGHLSMRPILVAERPAQPVRLGVRQKSELRLAVGLGES